MAESFKENKNKHLLEKGKICYRKKFNRKS